ncbi:hypothetical protein [Demequina sp.]|uniref:hypothetical protein n=1 Tax=Demequina sp. TaxID=2050685 RepID=UPI003D0FDB69
MPDELKDALLGGLDAKRQLFADEDFAGEFGRGVAGRVKRRRALSATAAGGVSLAGVGAVAFGASQVPWSGWVFAGPAASPYVVCTTSTPDAVESTTETSWPPKIFTFTDSSDGSTADVALSADEDPVLQTEGAALVALEDGKYRLTLPNGAQATIGFGIFLVGLPEGTDPNDYLTVSVFDGDVDVTSHRAQSAVDTGSGDALHVSPIPSPSGSVVWAVSVGDEEAPHLIANISIDLETQEVLGSLPSGDSTVLTPNSGGVYALQIDEGKQVTFTVINDHLELTSTSLEPAQAPAVTCVTITPEPGESAAATTSPAISAQATVTPDPRVSDSFGNPTATGIDPFTCGTQLGTFGHGSDTFEVVSAGWKSAQEVDAEFLALYSDPPSVPQTQAAGPLPVAAFQSDYWEDAGVNTTGYEVQTFGDPATQMTTSGSDPDEDKLVVGTTFIAVRDGEVVGLYRAGNVNSGAYAHGELSPPRLWGLTDPADALVACADGSLDAPWDLYAVGGVARFDGLEWTGPEYAWQKLDPAE